MKKAFSLLELIFAIVVIGIIASYAVPKYLNTKNNALATTIKRDIVTIISSIQSYHLINQKIDSISEAVTINESNWKLEKQKIIFNDKKNKCISIELKDGNLELDIEEDSTSVCKILEQMGIKDETFNLL